jgi:Fe2+ transport system protein B
MHKQKQQFEPVPSPTLPESSAGKWLYTFYRIGIWSHFKIIYTWGIFVLLFYLLLPYTETCGYLTEI